MVLQIIERKTVPGVQGREKRTGTVEVVAICPKCKALQTIWVNDGVLMSTRKFAQVGGRIYHDCGSAQPCRLYHSW
jgi:hypothetical protein